MTAANPSQPLRSVLELERQLGCDWDSIRQAADTTSRTIEELRKALDAAFDSEDYSIVVFGSLARHEFTPQSDLDWTLLVDGIAADDH